MAVFSMVLLVIFGLASMGFAETRRKGLAILFAAGCLAAGVLVAINLLNQA